MLHDRTSDVDLKAKHLVEYQITRRRAMAAGGTINREGSHDDPNVGPYELSFLGLSSPGS
jgi:hypothetical protein